MIDRLPLPEPTPSLFAREAAASFRPEPSRLSKAGLPGIRFENQTIRQALMLIDMSRIGAVIFVDEDEFPLGFLTDGDIRRALIAGAGLEDPISGIWNPKPLTMSSKSLISERHDLLAERRLAHVVIVGEDGRHPHVHAARDIQTLYERNPRSCPVLIMAGGRGERLMPLTKDCPKPMLSVAGRPLLQRTIEQLAAQGYEDFFISVRYLADRIRNHFGDGDRFGVNIRYLEETQPLGTGGCLRLLPPQRSSTLLILNGDVITDLRFKSLVSFHENERYAATMVVYEIREQLKYGVVRSDGPMFRRMEEKPLNTFKINTGIYAISTDALGELPTDAAFGLPDFFPRLIQSGRDCGVFEHHGHWIDIGDRRQLEEATRLMLHQEGAARRAPRTEDVQFAPA